MEKRSESKTRISNWAATLDLEVTHKPDLTEIVDSLMFREDDIGTATATGAYEIDYDDIDYFVLTLNTGGTCTITFTNINQGEIKYLKIDNTNLEAWEFSGATDHTVSDNIQNQLEALFWILNKDGTIEVKPISKDVFSAANSDMRSGINTSKFATPANVRYETRTGYKQLSNAESYNVADGIGAVEVPSGVSGGSITLPSPSGKSGQGIWIYSSGGNNVYVSRSSGPVVDILSTNYSTFYMCNGTTWRKLIDVSS